MIKSIIFLGLNQLKGSQAAILSGNLSFIYIIDPEA